MGCDIHCYIEYKHGDSWQCFGERINPGRNYRLFELLAGVRGDEKEALVQPRGIPKDIGGVVKSDWTLFISKTDGERYVTPEVAAQWVADGYAKYVDQQGEHVWVTNPDWHTHSWLTETEFAKVLEAYEGDTINGYQQEYTAVLAAMLSFVKSGFQTRLVFWFDN